MRLSSFLLFALLLITSGCSLLPDQIDETSEWSANQLYARAKQELTQQNYEKAIEFFEKLEARYPFGQYAQQAQLEIAYAYYKFEEPELAITAADRFIKIYPRHPNVDYAWYIKGLTNYNRGKAFIDRYLPQEPAERDTFTMRQSYDDFSQLVQRYPQSIYAKDAAQRMIHLRNNMAEYEIHVADYYMRRTAYVAAANRGKYVVENFQRTPAVEDALVIMVRAYQKLGVNDLADSAMRVLQLNYPGNPEIARMNDPRGYQVASQDTGFWGGWAPWKADAEAAEIAGARQETLAREGRQPSVPASDTAGAVDKPVPAARKESGGEPAQWGGWKPWKPGDAENTNEGPGLLENWKFREPGDKNPEAGTGQQAPSLWEGGQNNDQNAGTLKTDPERDALPPANDQKSRPQESGAPATENSEEQPHIWDNWKFWEQKEKDSAPETENGEEQPHFWDNWKFWEQKNTTSDSDNAGKQPGFRENRKGEQITPDTGTGAEEQEPSLWEGWQRPQPGAEATGTDGTAPSPEEDGKKPANWPGLTPWKPWRPGDTETESVPEDRDERPRFWEDLKFWKKDSGDTETPETEDGKEKPAFWEGWKFWETEPEEAPAGNQEPGH